MSSLGFGFGDLYALAAKQEVVHHHNQFGIVGDPDALDHEIVELRKKYADQLKQIESSITESDIVFDPATKRPISRCCEA